MGNVKSFTVDPAKALWRERIVDFVRQHYTPNQIRNFRVLCFAGREMTEVFDVYDELGVKRKNVVSLECDPHEYEAMCTVNDTLEQRIKIVPATALEYLSRPATQPFDLISLDYCGYFEDDKVLTFNKIALNNWLSSKAVLITNYQSGRENAHVQKGLRITGTYAKAHRELVMAGFKEHRQFVLQNVGVTDDETELTKLRDAAVQCTPVAEMVHGTGFWNTDFFKVWLQGQPTDVREPIKDSLELLNHQHEPEHRDLISKFIMEQQERTSALLMIYFMKNQMRSFDCTARGAYKYISDSGTPMISDFYLFEEEIWNISEKGRRSVTYEQTPTGPAIRIRDMTKVKEVLQRAEQHVQAMKRRAFMEGNTKIVLERVILGERHQKQGQDLPEEKEYSRKTLQREEIYAALASGTADDEIRSTYGLTKMQLAGYKATHTRTNNGENHGGRRKTLATPFAPADLEVITGLLTDGYRATEIATLFVTEEGTPRYSWQSIAAYKATETRTGGRVSNERLFKQMKPQIMERDGHACQWCNKAADEQRERSGHSFHVHHINYDHNDTRLDNLVTLCTSCHARTNTIQYGGEMREYFELLMAEKHPSATTSA